jgi:glucose-6-phosphate 1-dehydrogenase
MFDIIDYALKNNVSIVIDPYSEVGLKITVGTGVLTAENATTVDCGFHMEVEPDKAQEACERILGMIRERNASLFDYMNHSKKRAEMEKFWKESTPIMTGEDDA